MSESIYRQMVHELAADGHTNRKTKREIREDIVSRVDAAHAAGEPWAAEVLARWDREGAESDYEKAHGALNTTTYITRDGRRKKKTTSYSLPRRSAASGEVVYEQSSFWGYERPEFNGKRSELVAQRGRIDDVVAAFDRVIAAWDRHPDAVTAREAWEADGRSVSEIDLGSAA